jgi:hypothetical protein
VKLRLEGALGTALAIEGEQIVLAVTEVQRVEHHTDKAPMPDGWEMTTDGAEVAIGPLHYVTGMAEIVLSLGHAEELGRALVQAVAQARQPSPVVDVPRPGIVLPDGVRLRGDGRQP